MLWDVKAEQFGNSAINTSACWVQGLEPLGQVGMSFRDPISDSDP